MKIEGVDYTKIPSCTNKADISDPGVCLEKVKTKSLSIAKVIQIWAIDLVNIYGTITVVTQCSLVVVWYSRGMCSGSELNYY